MDVAVVGAGPGGLAAAHGLLRAGHDVQVHERAGSLRPGGSAVTLWPNGTAVLRSLGVPLDDLGARIDVLDGRDHRGRPLLQMRTAALVDRFGAPALSVRRRDLVERLAGALPDRTLRFGSACASVEADGGRLLLADGSTIRADVVVGADGRDSAVRGAVRPDARPRLTGWVTWQGLSRLALDVTSSTRIVTMLGPGGFVGLQPAGDGLLQWYVSVPPSPGGADATEDGTVVDLLRRRFGGWASPVPQVLEAIGEEPISPWPHASLQINGAWGAGRATLLGDAAHAMPPSLAQGVNQTLEDVHALTASLSAVPPGADPSHALRRYEAVRARQVRRIAAMAASEASTTYRRSTSLLMRAMPPRFATGTYNRLISRSSSLLAHRSGAA